MAHLVRHLQDLPDVQELIAEVNAEKYSLQAAAILGEGAVQAVWCKGRRPAVCCCASTNACVSDTDETVEAPSQQQVRDNTVRAPHGALLPCRWLSEEEGALVFVQLKIAILNILFLQLIMQLYLYVSICVYVCIAI